MSAGGDTLSCMRPAIKAGLLMVWRDPDTLQIGIDPRRAIALRGMRGAEHLINLLDGSRDLGQVLAAARGLGIGRQAAERVIGLLAAAGALHDFPAATVRALPDGPRDRLARELASVSLAHGHTDGGALVLARRQAASVRVHGTSLVASGLASLLTASGVGRVSGTGAAAEPAAGGPRLSRWPPAGRVRLGHPAAERPPAAAARAGAGRGARGPGHRPDLAVLVDGYLPELPGSLAAGGVPHLTASASEAIGVVGPLVVPGQTACLSCVGMARTDRDPAWPLILAQMSGRVPQPAACAAVLVAAVAAQASAQALAFLDRAGPALAVINGTLELVLPDWQWRRHSWVPHPQCRCSRRAAS
jgi:bacteriocin biosynthesis cyclodehydratase domain-containing protein